MELALERYFWTIEKYHRAIEAGVFAGDDRFELIRGDLFKMAAIGSRHASAVKRVGRKFLLLENQKKSLIWLQFPITFEKTTQN